MGQAGNGPRVIHYQVIAIEGWEALDLPNRPSARLLAAALMAAQPLLQLGFHLVVLAWRYMPNAVVRVGQALHVALREHAKNQCIVLSVPVVWSRLEKDVENDFA